MLQSGRRCWWGFGLLVGCMGLPVVSQSPSAPQGTGKAAAPSYASDPKFEATMKEAKQFLHLRMYALASDDYKKANKMAGGQCLGCLQGLYTAQMGAGNQKEAGKVAAEIEQIATTPRVKSFAQYEQGEAIYASAGAKPKPDKLEAAHTLLQQAIATYPQNAAALFLDGTVMARLGKMEEAKASFTQCLTCVNPDDPTRLRASHFAENPELATQPMAPAFEVTALDGSRFNLDAMGGRVVLIDFWATWCGPCNREIPHMKAIAKEFAGQPLVMISVSLDKNEAAWKSFVAKHEMTWEQYRDVDGKLGEEFGVSTIPRYFTIDSDGVLTSVLVDEGSDVEGRLRKLVARAREAQRQATTAQPPTTAGN